MILPGASATAPTPRFSAPSTSVATASTGTQNHVADSMADYIAAHVSDEAVRARLLGLYAEKKSAHAIAATGEEPEASLQGITMDTIMSSLEEGSKPAKVRPAAKARDIKFLADLEEYLGAAGEAMEEDLPLS